MDALRTGGHDVTILHRDPTSGEGLIADRNNPASVRAALHGRRFEAVFDNVYDWQRGTTAAQVEATARECAGPDLKRYIFMSTVAAYGSGLNHSESDPLAAPDHPEEYVRNKAESERALFRMHRESGFPSITLRPPFIYGPGNPFYREAFFWDRLRDRRPILLPDDGTRLMQFTYVHDLVRCCLKVLDNPDAVGRAFNVADKAPVTQQQAVLAFARAAGVEPDLKPVPRQMALDAGGHPMGPKLYFATYYDLPPITMRIDAARDALGFEPTPFDVGLRRTFEWWLGNNTFPRPDYTFEDQVFSRSGSN